MKLQTIERVLGAVLYFSGNDQREIYAKIKPAYLTSEITKRVYNAMSEIVKENRNIDLVSLTHKFKALGYLDKNVVIYLSNLTSENGNLIGSYSVGNLLIELESERIYSEALAYYNKLGNALQPEVFTIEKFNNLVTEAKSITIEEGTKSANNVETIFKIIDSHYKAKAGEVIGLELPYAQLKGVTLLESCDVLTIGARPAMGKTAFAVNTAVKLALAGKKVALFSLEMSKEQILRRVVSNMSRVNSNKIKYGLCSEDEIELIYRAQSNESLNNLFIFEGTQSINDITRIVYDQKAKTGLDVFIVDYLQKIQPKTTRSRYEAVTEISNGIKLISQNYGVPAIALAQLSRDSSKLGKRPSLPDLKESGEIEQDASIVAFLHRPEYYGETETYNGSDSANACEFIIAKNREGELGIYDFTVDLSTSKFW